MCLEPYQASVVELFCGNREWFLADKNFTGTALEKLDFVKTILKNTG